MPAWSVSPSVAPRPKAKGWAVTPQAQHAPPDTRLGWVVLIYLLASSEAPNLMPKGNGTVIGNAYAGPVGVDPRAYLEATNTGKATPTNLGAYAELEAVATAIASGLGIAPGAALGMLANATALMTMSQAVAVLQVNTVASSLAMGLAPTASNSDIFEMIDANAIADPMGLVPMAVATVVANAVSDSLGVSPQFALTMVAGASAAALAIGPVASLGVQSEARAESLIMSPIALAAPVAEGWAEGLSLDPRASNNWPVTAETTTQYTGNATPTIPYWSNAFDLACVGGGGGGQGSGCCLVNGFGAAPGTVDTMQLVRGLDVPWSQVSLNYTNGNGGGGGPAGIAAIPGTPGAPGGNSSWFLNGTEILRGELGLGGALGVWGADVKGGSVTPMTFNGKTYSGGAGGQSSGANGQEPGGGGAAGAGGFFAGTKGGNGGKGRGWLRAYQ